MKKYIAHRREDDGAVQYVDEHVLSVAQIAEKFAQIFECGNIAYICGLLHDIGKFSEEFLKRIVENGPKCDHSTAGAQLFKRLNCPTGDWFAYIILGHHGGLPDYWNEKEMGTFFERMGKKVPDYSAYKTAFQDEEFIIEEPPKFKQNGDWGFKVSFLIRMLYSCIVDADYLDTEHFMHKGKVDRKIEVDFSMLQRKLDEKLAGFKQDTLVNQYRKKVLDSCLEAALRKPGMFQLTVPTGGGKTIASVAFALKHLHYNKDQFRRIIYVIPYCSIIEQNAKVFTGIFGENIVLEHHSNYDFDGKEDDFNDKKKLASENWDMPLVVTTNVQFFESLFSNKPSKCRKLHNIAGSILIFDEVQAIPTNYLAPCMQAIEELVQEYGCSAVLCSATQPKLDRFFHYKLPIYELSNDPDSIFEALKRTRLIKLGEIDEEDLVNRINQTDQVLVVINKRKTTKQIYNKLKEIDPNNIYHLSTDMCPEHRKAMIAEIRDRLNLKLPCKVISTNLIEAGVDLDFQAVYRELAGIDSIIQAAGRANREGKRENLGEVYVFSFIKDEDRVSTKNPYGKYLDQCAEHALKIIEKYDDIFCIQAIDEYFTNLYKDLEQKEFDGRDILKRTKDFFDNGKFRFNFKELADMFKLIDEDTYPVLVPYKESAKAEIERISNPYYIFTKKDIRANQKYMVNLRMQDYIKMQKQGRIKKISEGFAVLTNEKEYKDDTGLEIEIEFGIGMFI